jgi:hypothetical protein
MNESNQEILRSIPGPAKKIKPKLKPRNKIERPAVASTVVEHSTANPKIEGSNLPVGGGGF